MLKLRELRREDLLAINSWRADRSQVACLGAPFRYIGPEVDGAWFDSYLKNRSNTVRCAIVDVDAPQTILGLATLSNINWVHRTCIFHVQVAPGTQGCGVGAFALAGMLSHAFEDLGLNRVELAVLDTNSRARGMYERAGFVLEGTKRQAAYKEGHYVDMHIMGLLASEWRARNAGRALQ